MTCSKCKCESDCVKLNCCSHFLYYFLEHYKFDVVRYFVPSSVIISKYLNCSMVFMCHRAGLNKWPQKLYRKCCRQHQNQTYCVVQNKIGLTWHLFYFQCQRSAHACNILSWHYVWCWSLTNGISTVIFLWV